MQRKLTITIADEVYRGLHQQVGRGEISRFIENLVRPHVVVNDALEAAYREAALDEEAEREALEWIEGTIGDGLDDDDAW
ncbi:MAG TPA: hypothetical protein VIR57_24695 [Chloroflexota bacterium]|jgi:predicted CopG family antitoxin